jgi:phosphatidate cytidylyltransferase
VDTREKQGLKMGPSRKKDPTRQLKLAVLRVFTGMLVAGITITCVHVGAYGYLLYLLILNGLALSEFYRLFRSEILLPRTIPGIIFSSVLLLLTFLVMNGITDGRIFLLIIPAVFSFYIFELYARAANPFQNLAITFLGLIFISLPLNLFLCIAFLPAGAFSYHPEIIFGIFIMLWAGDSGAFFFGKRFGKRHLFKRISPHKTWEGSLGGAISTITAIWIFSRFDPAHRLSEWFILAAIIIITGTFGDFIKSLMKRSLHVKDSGKILPGHGGILDRFDTLLGSAPFIFVYLILSAHA